MDTVSLAAPSSKAAEAPHKSSRQPEVLDEDEWTRQIETIIERDFFPDLPKLQNKLEWLKVRTDCKVNTCLLFRCTQAWGNVHSHVCPGSS